MCSRGWHWLYGLITRSPKRTQQLFSCSSWEQQFNRTVWCRPIVPKPESMPWDSCFKIKQNKPVSAIKYIWSLGWYSGTTYITLPAVRHTVKVKPSHESGTSRLSHPNRLVKAHWPYWLMFILCSNQTRIMTVTLTKKFYLQTTLLNSSFVSCFLCGRGWSTK